jgi:hypothetical protein
MDPIHLGGELVDERRDTVFADGPGALLHLEVGR